MENTGAVRQIWCALSCQVRQEEKPVTTDGHGANLVFQLRVIPAERLSDMLRNKGKIQCADQWQPIVRAVAKGRHFAFWIDDWSRGEGEQRSRCSQARGHHPRLDIAGSDCGHHVVAAACTHQRGIGETPLLAEVPA